MLHVKNNGEVIDTVPVGGWAYFPNGMAVSPAEAGWSYGPYTIEVAPEPPAPTPEEALAAARAGMRLTFAQLLIGLVTEEWITQAEGEAWLTGTPPADVLTLIAALPTEQQFPALARAVRPSEVLRLDPLVVAMASFEGKTPEEVDTFFTTYAMV